MYKLSTPNKEQHNSSKTLQPEFIIQSYYKSNQLINQFINIMITAQQKFQQIQEQGNLIGKISQLVHQKYNRQLYANGTFTKELRKIIKNHVPLKYNKFRTQEQMNKNLLTLKIIVDQIQSSFPESINFRQIQHVKVNHLSNTSIRQQFYNQISKKVRFHLSISENLLDFLKSQKNQMIDIIHRKCSLGDYLDIVTRESSSLRNDLGNALRSLTITDLTIFLMRSTDESDLIPLLLTQQSAAVPIVYSTKRIVGHYPSLLRNLLSNRSYPIILNIWSAKAAAKLKKLRNRQSEQKAYFCELLGIDPKSLQGSAFEGSVNLFKLKLKDNKQVLLVSMVSYGTDRQTQQTLSKKISLMKKLIKVASLLVFHIDDEFSLTKQSVPKMFFDYHFLLRQKIKTIFIAQLSQVPKSEYYSFILNIRKDNFQNMLYCFPQKSESSELLIFQQLQRLKLFLETVLFSNEWQSKYQASYQHFIIEQDQKPQQLIQRQNQMQNNIKNMLSVQQKQPFLHRYKKIRQINELNMKIRKIKFQPFIQLAKDQQFKIFDRKAIDKSINQRIETIYQQEKTEDYYKSCHLCSQYKQLQFIHTTFPQQKYYCYSCFYLVEQTSFKQSLQHVTTLKNDREYEDPLIEQFIKYLFINGQRSWKLINKTLIANAIQKQNQNRNQFNNQYECHITIDNIIQEISIFSEILSKTKLYQQNNKYQQYINKFYQNCLDQLQPFSLINGQASSFGNEGLWRFFKKLNERYNRTKVYVVSVIEMKGSSGKSELLNYLFRYNIEFIEDPYAKGVYMSVCQIDDKIIVVLDVLGVFKLNASNFSTQANEQQLRKIVTFDHQVASLLMKESDLVIISGVSRSNRQIGSQKDQFIIKTCSKILDALYDNSKQQVVAKNVILTFSNQPDINYDQQELLEASIQLFSPLSKYVIISAENIFLLPKIYKNDSKQLVNTFSQDYGIFILGLRSRIMRILQTQSNPRKFIDFFQNLNLLWTMMLLTTEEIIQIMPKSQIQMKQKICNLIRGQYFLNFKHFVQSNEENSSKIEHAILALNQKIQRIDYQVWTYIIKSFLSQCLTLFNKYPYQNIESQLEQTTDQNNHFRTYLRGYQREKNRFQGWLEERVMFQARDQRQEKNKSRLFLFIFHRYIDLKDKFLTQFLSNLQGEISNISQKMMNKMSIEDLRLIIFKGKKEQILKQLFSKGIFKSKKQFYLLYLNDIFKIASSNLFEKGLRINDLRGCLDFESKLSKNYTNNLHLLIYFPEQNDTTEEVKIKLKNVLVNYISKYSQQIISNSKQLLEVVCYNMVRANQICSEAEQQIKWVYKDLGKIHNTLEDQKPKYSQHKNQIQLNWINFKIVLIAKLFKYLVQNYQPSEHKEKQFNLFKIQQFSNKKETQFKS